MWLRRYQIWAHCPKFALTFNDLGNSSAYSYFPYLLYVTTSLFNESFEFLRWRDLFAPEEGRRAGYWYWPLEKSTSGPRNFQNEDMLRTPTMTILRSDFARMVLQRAIRINVVRCSSTQCFHRKCLQRYLLFSARINALFPSLSYYFKSSFRLGLLTLFLWISFGFFKASDKNVNVK